MIEMIEFGSKLFYKNSMEFLAVSKKEYNKEEAIEIAKKNIDFIGYKWIAITDGFVKYNKIINNENNCIECLTLEFERSIPCWVLYKTNEPYDGCSYRRIFSDDKGVDDYNE